MSMKLALAAPTPSLPLARATIPALGVALAALLYLVHLRTPETYAGIFWFWGVAPIWPPFFDLHGVLSSVQCYRLGVDVYAANPCDIAGRVYNYSPLILGLAVFDVTVDWVMPGGLILGALFLVALASLPQPRGAYGWTITLLATFSTMTIFAVERCNGDVAIFLIAIAAGHLLARRAAPALGYALAIFAAMLKLYPVALLILALRERLKILIAVLAVALLAFIAYALAFESQLARALDHVPTGPYFTDLFGAKNLPGGLADLVSFLAGAGPQAGGGFVAVRAAFWAVAVAAFLWQAFRVAARGDWRDGIAMLAPAPATFLVLGAAVILFCFFGAQNVGYRGIFFLPLLPGLLLNAPGRRVAALIVFLMWGEAFREGMEGIEAWYGVTAQSSVPNLIFWLVRELIWWRVVSVLGGVLLIAALPRLRRFAGAAA